MRFIVDESAGMAVVKYLRTAGHEVLAAAEATKDAALASLEQSQDERY